MMKAYSGHSAQDSSPWAKEEVELRYYRATKSTQGGGWSGWTDQ